MPSEVLQLYLKRVAKHLQNMDPDDIDDMSPTDFIKALEQLVPAPRNPHIDHDAALTRGDIEKGVSLLVVGYGGHERCQSLKVAALFVNHRGDEFIRTAEGGEFSLSDMGVTPYATDYWNPHYATFRYDTETCRSVAEWLASKSSRSAAKSATRLIEQHAQHFKTEVVVKDGKIVTRLKPA